MVRTKRNPWKLATLTLGCLLLISTAFHSVTLRPENDNAVADNEQSSWGSRLEAMSLFNSHGAKERSEAPKPSIWGMMVRTRTNIGQAFVTVENIRALGTSYHFHFFLLPVGDDHITVEEFFSDEFTEIFSIMNVTREILPLFPYPNQWIIDSLPYGWNYALHRLSMFGMYDKFNKILLTDADVVFVAPVDELFTLTKTALVMFPEPGQCVLPDTATGGFVFIRPEEVEFDKMMAYAEEHADDRNPYWAVGEKTFLGNYYKTDLDQRKDPSTVLTLSHMYTYPLHDCKCTSLDFDNGQGFKNLLKAQLKIVKVYHFTPGPKPWFYHVKNSTVDWSFFGADDTCVHPVVEQYYEHRASMVAKLTDEHLYSLRICRTVNDKACTPQKPS